MADVTVEILPSRPAWSVPLSSSRFTGTTDDARLTSALTWAAAQTYKPTIVLDEMRTYTFSQSRNLFSGLSISGPDRPQDQARSSKPIGNQVNLRMNGGWFNLAQAQTFGCAFTNLSLDGNASSRLVAGHASNVLWTSVFRDISCQNAASVLGSSAVKLLNTACTIDGWWNVNNVQDRAFNLGGSDTYFKPSQMLLDSPPDLMVDSGFLLSYSQQAKGELSGLYCTADGHSGILLTGGSTMFTRNVVEGRNANTPCSGALIRVVGGRHTLRDNFLNYAMTNPAATGRNDAGVIHIESGNVVVDGVQYDRAAAATDTTPLIYAGPTAKVRVSNVLANFTPTVLKHATATVVTDSSVRVVTA